MIEDVLDEDNFERSLTIGRSPDAVAEAMRFVELAVSGHDLACREALVLAASELAENVLKYGVTHPDLRAGTLSVSIRGCVARVRATNAVASTDDARTVIEITTRMATASSDAKERYQARMRELFENPGAPRARLGLLRLAFEGGFRVSASFDPPLLQIVAERTCRDR